MKNLLYILNIALLLCVVYLMYVHFSSQTTNQITKTNKAETGIIAYINTDSLTTKYQLAIDLNEKLTSKQEDIRTDLNIEGKKIEKMMKSFQRKINNNGFTSRERAQREQEKIIKKQEDLQAMQDRLTKELFEEQEKMLKRLGDTISNFLEQYNISKGYDLILRTTKNGNVLYGKKVLDITDEVVKMLNDRYSSEKNEINEKSKI